MMAAFEKHIVIALTVSTTLEPSTLVQSQKSLDIVEAFLFT
ncbi:hypothetical protein MNBD_GAMMA05-324 [hydrothermal vent metagenome]|uniref:Uncharacterized protein n=1 Tax=hydrothermal vent metagenome TaxID=652676 RepID=A0A3B0WDK3_9ZZZZ